MPTIGQITISGSLTVSGSLNMTGSSAITGSFSGNGSGLTGVTGSWTGFTSADAQISGSLNVSSSVTASAFKGDGSGLTGVTGEWDGTFTGSAEISGSLRVEGRVSQIGLGTSTYFGFSAGDEDDKTNNANTAFGHNAFKTNETGNQNTAVGFEALKNNSNGSGNTTIGYSSMTANTGQFNTAVGNLALSSDNSGDYNTTIGNSALFNNTSGDCNTTIGTYTLFANDAGNNNTAVGYGAGCHNTGSGTNNVFIGYTAGPLSGSSVSNQLYINNNSGSALVQGDFSKNSFIINGNITASGNISSSGDVYADDYFINNISSLDNSGTRLRVGYNTTHTEISLGRAGTTTKVDIVGEAEFKNNITASGDISASGDIRGNEIFIDSKLYTNGLPTVVNSGGTITLGHTSQSTIVTGSNVILNSEVTASQGISIPNGKDLVFPGHSKITMDGDFTIEKGIGNNSVIKEAGTGDLMLISNNEVEIASGEAGETFARFTRDAGIELYTNNVKKFETTATGIIVSGSITGSSITVGALTSSTNPVIHAKTSNTSENILLESTDTGAGSAPDLVLFRNAGAPSDNDTLGVIEYKANQIGGSNPFVYNGIYSRIIDASQQQSALTISAFYGSSTSHAIGIHNLADNTTSGAVIINPTGFAQVPQHTLQVEGTTSISSSLFVSGSTVIFNNLPTSNPNVAGQLYNDGGTLKISAG